MKIPALVLLGVALVLALGWVLRPDPDPSLQVPRTDLPWQVQGLADGTSEVFGLRLGQATLADAVTRFGPYRDMAVFTPEGRAQVLEAYFGKVAFGPLKAEILVTLNAGPQALARLVATAGERQGSPSGDWRYPVATTAWPSQQDQLIRAITYVPTYTGLEPSYLRERFGEPQAWRSLDRDRIQWFYPAKGLSVLWDPDGKEVFEFVVPAAMQLPQAVQTDPLPARFSGSQR